VLGGIAATALIAALASPSVAGAGCPLPILCLPGPGEPGEDPQTAPDPGGDESASVGVPPPDAKRFGVHQTRWETGPYELGAERTAQIAHNGGANALRFGLDWSSVEPVRDTWAERTWGRYERMYRALIDRRMTPLITIGFPPTWARDPGFPRICVTERGCEYPPAPSMYAEWEEFAAEVTRRFPAAAIEIWNEPNIDNYWKPRPEPERYAALAARAVAAIEAVNPSATVIGGSLSPAAATVRDPLGRPVVLSVRDFLRRAYAASPSLAGRLDALSLHTSFQKRDYGADTLFAEAFENLREIRDRSGDAGLPIWITESGISVTGLDAVSRAQQADGLQRQYRRLMTMPDVDALFIHTLFDRYEALPTDRERGYGLAEIPDPFVPRPAYCVFAAAASTPPAESNCPP
jgi:polysaccharide biosynthesis protein PslG